MDQSLVHTFSWGNSYGPMVLKVLLEFPPTLVLVHGWLFPALPQNPKGSNGIVGGTGSPDPSFEDCSFFLSQLQQCDHWHSRGGSESLKEGTLKQDPLNPSFS